MKTMKILRRSLVLTLCAICTQVYAQEADETCGFDALLQAQLDARGMTREDLEAQMQSHMAQYERFQLSEDNTIYKIPVVFHILHRGEAEGEGNNIATEEILAQVRATNDDLRRRNTNTDIEPPEFRSLGVDVGIELVLAKRDPEGLPTNGIVRVEIPETYRYDHPLLYAHGISKWPDRDYLNVWVVPGAGLGFLGVGSFPFAPDARLTDFNRSLIGRNSSPFLNTPLIQGTYNSYNFYSIMMNNGAVKRNTLANGRRFEGAVLTHEVGHYLGLYHIWGDGDCRHDDFCADTPRAGGPNYTGNCSDTPRSCDSRDMIYNYMDYTYDQCKSMLTLCQRQRMRTALRHTYTRSALLRSPGLEPFVTRPLDLGLRQILSPRTANCTNEHHPSIGIANYGEEVLNEYTIELYVNEVLQETVTTREALSRYEKASVLFAPIFLEEGQSNTFSFRVTNINGNPDAYTANNELSVEISSHTASTFPLVETFDNPDNIHWGMDAQTKEKIDIVDHPAGGKMLKFPFYNDAAAHEDQVYTLSSPYLRLAENRHHVLRFRYSYTAHEESHDFLGVYAASGCWGFSEVNRAIRLPFRLYGIDLQTSLLQARGQAPKGLRDWKEAEISLSGLPRTGTQLYIIAISDAGNNIYLDDLRIEEHVPSADRDLGIVSIHTLPITCNHRLTHLLNIKNYGVGIAHVREEEITTSLSLQFNSFVGGETETTINPGAYASMWERGNISIDKGAYALRGNITRRSDEDMENNERTTYVYKTSRSSLFLPSAAAYDPSHRDNPSAWDFYNPDKPSDSWVIASLEENGRTHYPLRGDFFNSKADSSYWLMSPLYELSYPDQVLNRATLSFRVSYAARQGRRDRLSLVAIKDCDLYVDALLYDKAGQELSAGRTSEERWQPTSDAHWTSESIDLSQYLDNADELQLAFIASSAGGNAIFIDSIQLHVETPPSPVEATPEEPLHTALPPAEQEAVILFPNPNTGAIHLRFKLQERQDIVLSLSDEAGKSVWRTSLKDVQQEAASFMPAIERQKLYILRIEGSKGFSTIKRYIRR